MDEKKVPPAKGLKILTWAQVENLDDCIAQICAVGEGEVTIVIKRGLPRLIRPMRSLVFEPVRK